VGDKQFKIWKPTAEKYLQETFLWRHETQVNRSSTWSISLH